MARHPVVGTCRDTLTGQVRGNTTVEVYLAGGTTPASIYTASTGGTAVNSVLSDVNGQFIFWLDESDYALTQLFKVLSVKVGYDTITYDNLALFNLTCIDTDGTMAGNSDKKVSTQKAVVTYVAAYAQPKHANLTAIAGYASVANLGTVAGYASIANLTALVGLTGAADKFPYFTAAGAMSVADVSSFARTILDDTTAAAVRTTIGAAASASVTGNLAQLTAFWQPSIAEGCQGAILGGFSPFWFNQQWGGAPMYDNLVDGATGVAHTFQAATGYMEFNDSNYVGQGAGNYYAYTSFKVSSAITCQSVWIRLFKILNPTDNVQLYLYSDNGSGYPSTLITNGTATPISGTSITSLTIGEWYRFVFATPPSLSANTKYHVVVSKSGGVDASNYYRWCNRTTGKVYPHGNQGSGTSVPVWSEVGATTYSHCFMVEPTASYQPLQSGGQFDSKWVFSEGSPLDQSPAWTRPLEGMWNGNEFCFYGLWEACTKDRTIMDAMYGLDHDRINLKVNVTTGYASLNVYETDKTLTSVTATATDLSSGTHAIGGIIRAKNDGSDYIKLYIDGTWYTSTGLSLEFDKLFRVLGNMTLGGGWRLAPAWTFETLMGTIPSGDGWTYSGTATEAAHAVVSGGKLFIKTMGLADQCNWYRYPTWSNANGSFLSWKSRIPKSYNVVGSLTTWLELTDGTKDVSLAMHEHWDELTNDDCSSFIHKNQSDNKNQDQCFAFSTKGSDFFWFKNGKLLSDGTGLFKNAGANNRVFFGGIGSGSGYNSESVWDYIKGYTGSSMFPEFTSGSLHEFAFWSGDASALFDTFYNSGTFQSIKTICGIQQNYIYAGERKIHKVGLTNNPTTTSTSAVLVPDMEGFIYGADIDIQFALASSNNGTNSTYAMPVLDRKERGTALSGSPTAGYPTMKTREDNWKVPFGLHKFEGLWYVPAGTETAYGAYYREIIARAK